MMEIQEIKYEGRLVEYWKTKCINFCILSELQSEYSKIYALKFNFNYQIKITNLQIRENGPKIQPRYSIHKEDHDSIPTTAEINELDREIEFRRKRKDYVAERLARKKEVLIHKKNEFGDSSSDDSNEEELKSQSSRSSGVKDFDIIEFPKQEIVSIPEKETAEPKNSLESPHKKVSESFERFSVHVFSKKVNEWMKDVLVIGEKIIIIENLTEEYHQISKFKIAAEVILGSPFKFKIKMANKESIFSVSTVEERLSLPPHYYVYAKIVQERLISIGIKLKASEKPEGISAKLIEGSLFYGKLAKKSQVLGNWEYRLVVINKNGIYSYKKENEKYSMFIPSGTISEMWTRFDIHDNFLVVKIWHSGKKTEFGFPLTENLTKNCWLYAFYSVMTKEK